MNLGRTQEMCHTVIIERKKRACLNCFQYGKVGRSLKKKKKKEKQKKETEKLKLKTNFDSTFRTEKINETYFRVIQLFSYRIFQRYS